MVPYSVAGFFEDVREGLYPRRRRVTPEQLIEILNPHQADFEHEYPLNFPESAAVVEVEQRLLGEIMRRPGPHITLGEVYTNGIREIREVRYLNTVTDEEIREAQEKASAEFNAMDASQRRQRVLMVRHDPHHELTDFLRALTRPAQMQAGMLAVELAVPVFVEWLNSSASRAALDTFIVAGNLTGEEVERAGVEWPLVDPIHAYIIWLSQILRADPLDEDFPSREFQSRANRANQFTRLHRHVLTFYQRLQVQRFGSGIVDDGGVVEALAAFEELAQIQKNGLVGMDAHVIRHAFKALGGTSPDGGLRQRNYMRSALHWAALVQARLPLAEVVDPKMLGFVRAQRDYPRCFLVENPRDLSPGNPVLMRDT